MAQMTLKSKTREDNCRCSNPRNHVATNHSESSGKILNSPQIVVTCLTGVRRKCTKAMIITNCSKIMTVANHETSPQTIQCNQTKCIGNTMRRASGSRRVFTLTETFTCIFALLLFLQSCVSFTCAIQTSTSASASALESASESTESKSDDPISVFLNKLALFSMNKSLDNNIEMNESELDDPDELFNDTNTKKSDKENDKNNDGKNLREINHFDTSSSTEFSCHHDCPVALPLIHENPNSKTFRPTVLPNWTAIMDLKRKNAQSHFQSSTEQSKSDETVHESNEVIPRPSKMTNKKQPRPNQEDISNPKDGTKLGPIRVFKYVHHPDELLTTSTEKPALASEEKAESSEESRVENNSKAEQSEEEQQVKRKENKEKSVSRRKDLASVTADRSLIRNSFFSGQVEQKKLNPNETRTIVINGTIGPDGFRPRRSPFRPHWYQDKLHTHREALYQISPPPHLHPPPPGLSAIPKSQIIQLHSPVDNRNVYVSKNPSPGPSPVPVLAVPVRVPASLTYNRDNMNIASIDRDFNSPPALVDGESPEEQSSFRLPNFQHPFAKSKPKRKRPPPDGRASASGHGNRRPPPPRHHPPRHGPQRGRYHGSPGGPVPSVMPPPRPIPVPRPRPQMHVSPSGRNNHHGPRPPPATIPYSYPKDAANIQDILSYFNTEENEIMGSHGKPPLSSSASGNLNSGIGMGGFSNELRDVQGSLLKDIREFAKRPSMMGDDSRPERDYSQEREREKDSKPIPLPVPPPDDRDNDPHHHHDIFNPKPKPVRDLIKIRHHDRDNVRESSREQSGSGSGHRGHYNEHHSPSQRSPQENDYGKRKRHRHPSPSYNNDDGGGNSGSSNNNDSQERDKNKSNQNNNYSSQYEDEYSKEFEQAQRPRYRDRNKHQSSHSNNNNHHDHNHHSSHYDSRDNADNQDDMDSDERQYSNNLQSSPSSYNSRERERNRDRGYGHANTYTPRPQYNSHKSHRVHKSHRSRPKNRNRHRNKSNKFQYSESHLHERIRQRTRDRDRGGTERIRPTVESEPDKPAKPPTVTTMDTAYYMQRNRPIVIKRPYQPYRPVDIQKIEQERKNQDKYWNTVTTLNVNDNKGEPTMIISPPQTPLQTQQRPPQTLQKHYHYYGLGASPSFPPVAPPPPSPSRMPGSTIKPNAFHVRHENSSPEEEDVLEIHTGSSLTEAATTAHYPVGENQYDRDKKARLQKMYMDYLQKKLEAQAEAQVEAMHPTTPPIINPAPKSKRPMRMKIHIYPNDNTHIIDRTNSPNHGYHSNPNPRPHPHPHPLPHPPFISASTNKNYSPSFPDVHRSGPSYGHYAQHLSPQIMAQPMHSQAIAPSTQTHAASQPLNTNIHHRPGAQTGVDKNKNVVLHLHVHRRNGVDVDNDVHMEMSGSETVTSTIKPLTYEEIFDTSNSDIVHMAEIPQENLEEPEEVIDINTQNEPGEHHVQDSNQNENKNQNHNQNQNHQTLDVVDSDKSLSMELPIHQDKIEDVLSTLLKLRN